MNIQTAIRRDIETLAADCVNCGICVKECSFLQEYGSPQKQAEAWLEGGKATALSKEYPYECSLCGLCHGVCPKKLDPSAMFLAMRQELAENGCKQMKQHAVIRKYERRGSSPLFSWHYFPEKCTTLFFPGCALPGNHPQGIQKLFTLLQERVENLGLVLDCCTKPSHDLGDQQHFRSMFGELYSIIAGYGITKVLVACPNCHRIFREYGQGIEVQSVYELLAGTELSRYRHEKEVTVHDPCGVRTIGHVQQSIRSLLEGHGTVVREMKHNGSSSFCCGEGGSAGFVRPELARQWTAKRVDEAKEIPIVSYCAGCVNFLGQRTKTYHVLDLLLLSPHELNRKRWIKPSKLIYWNRYKLKKWFQKQLPSARSGTRKTITHLPDA